MKRFLQIFVFVLALIWPLSAFSQVDSVRTQKGAAPVIVQNFKHNYVEVDRLFPNRRMKLSIPFSVLEYVRFADGFKVRFQDGKMVRDNLLSAPRYNSRLWTVRAEEDIELTQSEIRQLYGDRLFYTAYRPNRAQYITGMSKVVGGFIGFLTVAYRDPTFWGTPSSYSTLDHDWEEIQIEKNVGKLSVGCLSLECLLLGTFLTGFVDQASSSIELKALARQRMDMTCPSLGKAKAEFWGGTALAAAGVGTMGYFASRLYEHREWNHYVCYKRGEVTENIHQGEPASMKDLLGLFVGGVIVNLGVSAMQLGQARLSGFRKLEGTPYAMHVDLGPAPSGYGLTMRF